MNMTKRKTITLTIKPPTEILTPWGVAQEIVNVAEGITRYSTAGHGGYHLSPTMNKLVPVYLQHVPQGRRDANYTSQEMGWYEEDCAWAVVAVVFPTAFKLPWRKTAVAIMERDYPSQWAQFQSERDGKKFSRLDYEIVKREKVNVGL